MHKNISILCAAGIVILVCCSGCSAPTEFERVNPNDPLSEDFTPPEGLIGIPDNHVFPSRDVTIPWSGNETARMYQYTLDDTVQSYWTSDTHHTFTNLGEGQHTFSLVANNGYGSTGSPSELTFIVDAVQGPGIVFSPRVISGASEVTLTLEDVQGLMGAHIEVVTTNNCASLTAFTVNEEAAGNGQFAVFIGAEDSSHLIVDVAFLGGSEGIGSVEIGTLEIGRVYRNGKIKLDSKETVFRSVDNEDIQIQGLDEVTVTH